VLKANAFPSCVPYIQQHPIFGSAGALGRDYVRRPVDSDKTHLVRAQRSCVRLTASPWLQIAHPALLISCFIGTASTKAFAMSSIPGRYSPKTSTSRVTPLKSSLLTLSLSLS